MIKINHLSDFTLSFRMADGSAIPREQFYIDFFTRGGLRYTVSSDDNSRFKLASDGKNALIVFQFDDKHPHLPSGQLLCNLRSDLENNTFPRGVQHVESPRALDVELWEGASEDSKDYAILWPSSNQMPTEKVLYTLPFTHEQVLKWTEVASEYVGRIMGADQASEIGKAIKANKVVMIHTVDDYNVDGYYPCSAKVEDMVYINYLDNDGNVVAISFDISGTFDSADVKPIGLPAGGREDQVLSKYSDANQYAWIDLPAYTTIIQSFTAEDVKNAFHSGDESASDLMVSSFDITEIDKAMQEGKVILIRANEQSNSVYVCDAINEGGLVRITYRDTAAHTVSFRFNPEEAEPYIWIDRHTSSLPSGGEAGQVLAKTGEGIDDVEWQTPPTATYILPFTHEEVVEWAGLAPESVGQIMSKEEANEVVGYIRGEKPIYISLSDGITDGLCPCTAMVDDMVYISYIDYNNSAISMSFGIGGIFDTAEIKPIGVPAGGAVGQFLSKKSDKNYDTEWVDVPQGGDGDGGGGTVEGAVLYTPQTLTDEQKSQVAKNIGQPRERLILEWTNEEAEVLQPKTYDEETGYFTVETMPSWLAEDGAEAYGIINYADNVLCPAGWANAYGYIPMKSIPLPSGNEGTRFYVERVSESQIVLYTTKDKDTHVTIPSGVRCDGFYLTNELWVALKIPTLTGNIKYRLTINRAALRPSMYRKVGVQGIVGSGVGDHTDGGLGYQTKHHFETNSVYEFVVDFDNMKYIMTRIECNGQERTNATGETQSFVNPTLYGLYWEGIGNLPNSPTYVYINIDRMCINKYTTIKLYEIVE